MYYKCISKDFHKKYWKISNFNNYTFVCCNSMDNIKIKLEEY